MQGMNRDTGKPLRGLDHLKQSIRDILTTRVGTRVMRRDYGSELPALVDRPMNDDLTVDLYAATAGALQQWEPRVRLEDIRIAKAEVGRIELSLRAVYLPDGREITLDGIIVE
jgi:uncharacterized protein